MPKQFGWLLLMMTASVACADDPPIILPMPKTLPGSQKPPLIVTTADEDAPPALPLAELRHYLQKLKSEREGLNEDRVKAAVFLKEIAPDSTDIAALRLRLGSLLTTLGTHRPGSGISTPAPRKIDIPSVPPVEPVIPPPPAKEPKTPPTPAPPTPAPPTPAPPTPPPPPPDPDYSKALDPLALAQALFRAGNYPGALQAYRLLPMDGLKAEERAPVQYMVATCLRKLGKTDDAANLYREVANSRGDEHLAACAQWQLAAMRWHKETAEQLARVRQRRQELEKQP